MTTGGHVRVALERAAVSTIIGYQRLISPLLPAACRFAPTCSEYARVAVEEHGIGRGAWLSLRRLFRCHPLHPGGFDPPPPRRA